MTWNMGTPLRTAAPRRPGGECYHRVGREVDELNWAHTTMNVATNMDLDGWCQGKFFNAERWGEIRYEGSESHVLYRWGI